MQSWLSNNARLDICSSVLDSASISYFGCGSDTMKKIRSLIAFKDLGNYEQITCSPDNFEHLEISSRCIRLKVWTNTTGTKLSYFSYLNLPDSHKGWKNMNKVTTLIIPVSRLIYIKEVDTTVDQDGNEVSQ